MAQSSPMTRTFLPSSRPLVGEDLHGHPVYGLVAAVDGHPEALRQMEAGPPTAQLPLVGDVVVYEGSRLEVLDGAGRERAPSRLPPTASQARRQMSGRVRLPPFAE
jgi:hypothetical protein